MAKKISEINELILQGVPVAVLEYRGGKVEEIKIRDKRSGVMRPSVIVRHNCEKNDGTSVKITEWLPDGTDAKSVAIPFIKGAMVAVLLKNWEDEYGSFSASGELHALDANGTLAGGALKPEGAKVASK